MDGLDVSLADVDALARFADTFQVELFDIRIESDLDFVEIAIFHDFVVLDEFALLDDLEDRLFHLGVRHHGFGLPCFDGIAHPGEEVCDRISVHNVGFKIEIIVYEALDQVLHWALDQALDWLLLPARFLDSHDLATGSELPEANAANLEESEVSTATAAQFAAMVHTDPFIHFLAFGLELLFQPVCLDAKRFSSHKNENW